MIFPLSFTGGSLQINQSEEDDMGKYECVAENPVGTEHSKATSLYVKVRRVSPQFSRQPERQYEVPMGGNLTLTCVAVGSPMPYVKWKKGNALHWEFVSMTMLHPLFSSSRRWRWCNGWKRGAYRQEYPRVDEHSAKRKFQLHCRIDTRNDWGEHVCPSARYVASFRLMILPEGHYLGEAGKICKQYLCSGSCCWWLSFLVV